MAVKYKKKIHRLLIRLDSDQNSRLNELAAVYGVKKPALIRAVIDLFYNFYKKTKKID